jgi:hypothetical protein
VMLSKLCIFFSSGYGFPYVEYKILDKVRLFFSFTNHAIITNSILMLIS